ncbi:MAG: peroxiredoxin [Planctomycetes bacterium]|nr:peroxiredoxin [Planctomycetota bacterium]
MLTVGDKLPAFDLAACVSLEKGQEFKRITNQTNKGKWLVLFFWPKDFTFVCPTEIAAFDRAAPQFGERDAVVIGGSTDNEFSHLAWRQAHADLKGLRIPMIHVSPKFAAELGILHAQAQVALRATFIVDPEGVIRFVSVNDLSVGRNVDEVLRTLDALQTDELCPCNWKPGEKTLQPA